MSRPKIGEYWEATSWDENGNPLIWSDTRSCDERGAHWWERSTSIHDAIESRRCRQCGKLEFLGPVNEEERAQALAEMAVTQARLIQSERREYFSEENDDLD